jgi:peptide deformylase
MKVEFVSFLSLFVSAYLMLWIRSVFFQAPQVLPYQPPTPKIFENCEFPKHRLRHQPIDPGVISKNFCVERTDQHEKLRELLTHMRLVSREEEYDGVIALNFGVPLRVGYVRLGDFFLINPVFISGTGDKYCVEADETGRIQTKYNRYEEVVLTILDDTEFNSRREIKLTGAKSCIVQSELEKMNGVI